MTEPVMIWVLGGGFVFTGIVLGMTTKKLDKEDFEKHCKRQTTVNDKFEKAINENNVLLARVDERLKKDDK